MLRSIINKADRCGVAAVFGLSLLLLPTVTLAAPLKLVSFNIYNRPYERQARLENMIETLKTLAPDLIALQEVATGWLLPGDPALLVGHQLGMHLARVWHEQNWGIFQTGLAVLSRYPILESEYHEFSQHGFWDAKGFLFVRVQTPGGVLQWINLHMASTTNEQIRRSEWEELTRFVTPLRDAGPVLISGDFNTLPGHPSLQAFMKKTGATSIYDGQDNLNTLRTWTPNYRENCSDPNVPEAELVDYVFAVPARKPEKGLKLTLSNGTIYTPRLIPHPSDHCPISVQIQQNR